MNLYLFIFRILIEYMLCVRDNFMFCGYSRWMLDTVFVYSLRRRAIINKYVLKFGCNDCDEKIK